MDAPENEKLVLERYFLGFGQSYESRCGASAGRDKKLFIFFELKESQVPEREREREREREMFYLYKGHDPT